MNTALYKSRRSNETRHLNVSLDYRASDFTRVADLYVAPASGVRGDDGQDVSLVTVLWEEIGNPVKLLNTPFALTKDKSVLYVSRDGIHQMIQYFFLLLLFYTSLIIFLLLEVPEI
jgi:hypothetical protein